LGGARCHRSCRILLPRRFPSSVLLHLQAKTKPRKSTLDPNNFFKLKLKSVQSYNHNISRFTFELPNGGAALSPITSLVVVRSSEGSQNAPVNDEGNLAIRAYTPISSPHHEGELVLLIRSTRVTLLASTCMRGSSPATHLPSWVPSLKFPYEDTLRHLHTPFPFHHQTITTPRSLPFVPSLPFFSIYSRDPSELATAAVICPSTNS
jgi:FAD-dependent oxidoreductase family protein